MAIATLTIDLVAKLATLERDMGKAAQIAEKNAKRMESAFSAAGKALASIGAALSVGAFVGMVRNLADAGDHLQKLSVRTGLAVEELSKLDYAASISDVSTEDLGVSLTKLNRVMGDAADGSKTAADALARFGIAPNSGQTTIEVFQQIADRVKATGDETKIASALNDVFGKSYASLIPLLKEGGDGIKRSGDELERLGGVMSGDLAKSSEAFNDNLTKINKGLDALKIQALGGVVQSLEKITASMNSAAVAAGGLFKGLALLATVSGKESADPGAAANEISKKIQSLKKMRDELSVPTVANKINDFVFGDVGDLNKQIGFLKEKLKVLRSLQNDADAAAGGNYGNEGRSKTGAMAEILGTPKTEKAAKAAKATKAAKAVKEDKYTDLLTPAAEAYSRALESISQASVNAQKSTLDLNSSQEALYDLMRSPQWADMPEAWKHVAIAQSQAGAEAIKTAENYNRLKDMLAATPTEKLEQARESMMFLAKAFDEGKISAEQFSEAAMAALSSIPAEANKATDAMEEFSKQAARNIQDAFADFLFDPFKDGIDGMLKGFGDVVKRMIANAVAADLGKRLFGKASGGEGDGLLGAGLDMIGKLFANADGGVYATPGLSALSGRVLTSPTIIPMARGGILAGEAGPEAIMPLKHGADGKLGVAAVGSGGHTINVYVSGTNAPDVRRAAGQGAREAISAISGAGRYK